MKKSVKKFTAMLLSLTIGFSLVNTGSIVYAQEITANVLPDKTQFAAAEELKTFDTNDQDGKNPAKVYFGNNDQQWWIAGSQNGNVTLFAASPLATNQAFEPNNKLYKQYSDDWNCDYTSTGGSNPSDVYQNHYGASPLRTTLKNLETSYFTGTEQGLMNDTTIYTNDTRNNNSVYSTTDKLYLAYGDFSDDQHITVGKNSQDSLNNGLRIDKSYWGNSDDFWLRAPYMRFGYFALVAFPGDFVTGNDVLIGCALVPAFELNLSSVIFASAASAASSDGDLTLQDTDGDGAFTLRYDASKHSKNLGSALVSYDKSKVTLTGVPSGTYLVVQNNLGAKTKQIKNATEVSASDMGLDNFVNCKVWLETTSDRITYAALAEEEQGYDVNITASEGLTVSNGVQGVAQGSAITDITVEVTDGHYLPDGYENSIQGLNGLNVKDVTQNGFTISGTPTSDVNITLPAATVLPKSAIPEVTISKTKASITATVTNHKTEFGDIEYKWNDGNWEKDKNTLSNLQADTTYKLAVRFTGRGIYQPSDEYSVDITTLKNGKNVIVLPTGLTTTYKEGLTLSDVDLSGTGWTWIVKDMALSVGTNSYPVSFDTTALESTTDFSGVDGYDAINHKVIRKVEVKVNKADSSISITNTLDKAYDGQVVSKPEYTASGSNGQVTIKWQENTGTKEQPNWEDLKSAPSTVGMYRVVVELAGNDNYNPASATLDFVISQATNAWTEELSITGWTYNEKANVPTAKAQFGDVTFTYSSEENGTYTNEVPKNAGTWYVKATVAGTENYSGLESAPVAFEISKAIPAYEKVTGLVLGQGQSLSKIELPEQFKWVDETVIADELGTHTFKVIYTPEDIANYQTIEVEIEVEVVPTPVILNRVPTINASDKTITVGDKFDPLKDVTATDKEDGDIKLTKDNIIKNTVDTTKAGTYEVSYKVTDSQGATVTKTIEVTVNAKNVIVPDTGADSSNINNPETGDYTNLGLFTSLLMVSALGIAVLAILKKKKALNK